MSLIDQIIARAQSNKQRIVLPESFEERTITAADRAIADGLADIILIGNREKVLAYAAELGLKHIDQATIIDPETSEKTAEYANRCTSAASSSRAATPTARSAAPSPPPARPSARPCRSSSAPPASPA